MKPLMAVTAALMLIEAAVMTSALQTPFQSFQRSAGRLRRARRRRLRCPPGRTGSPR